jgi:hypothetical protein
MTNAGKYPKYRVSQWIDTGLEGVVPFAERFAYGVQAQRAPRARWLHCADGCAARLFATRAEAEAACQALREEAA